MPLDAGARLLAAAALLAEAVAARAVRTAGGGVAWLRDVPGPPAPLPPHLYDGTAGIALFLAADDRVRGRGAHRPLVLAALAPLAARLGALAADSDRAAALRLPVGGMVGLGSWAYALARAGAWTGDSALVDGALAAARLLDPSRREGAPADVVDGWAGAVLALLALDAVHPAPDAEGVTPLERASRAARPLLAAAPPPIGGFAHGASGVACALLRLHARTGEGALREAAHRAFEVERALFDAAAGNWRDPRHGGLLEQAAWCHGAPGIALARAAVLGAEPGLRAELEACLALVRALPPAELDHLCCGNAGRAGVLLATAGALGDAGPAAEGAALALALAERASAGTLRLGPPGETAARDPALFRGLSGIGYALLHAASPDELPSVLSLA